MKFLGLVEIPYLWVPWGVETLVNTITVLACTVLAGLYLHQDKLIYMASMPPGSRTVVATPDQSQMSRFEHVELRASDGVRICGYWIRHSDKPKRVLLYLHANAGNMGHRLPIARAILNKAGTDVFMLSYRGYGLSEGVANEKGIKLDSQAALDWITEHKELSNAKIILYGQSIGGAVAIDLASRNPTRISAVIVENTFLSLPKLIPTVMPYLKYFTFLCHQIWDSENAVKLIPPSVPMLFLSGGKDELIPQQHMVKLAQVARATRGKGKFAELRDSKSAGSGILARDSDDVRWVELPDGTHNDTCIQYGYFDELALFVRDFKV
ncbi:hypothetical protein CcCBS67573_g02535 [Chytriomyces confervae]|uniref:AB hydrolase-1 domain-containing protein n=1 Tax=Chytriomyces confervae TaxID=246404 RepID=A0A507FJ09_9FUNG|nr:hypothetical protein CcCBS67573_g02535 [Chytriomyces confervae]